MFYPALRLAAVLLSVSLTVATIGAPDRTAYAASANLVWKPYLQQLTDTGVIVRWTTKTGSSSIVRYSTDASYSASAGDSARTIAAQSAPRQHGLMGITDVISLRLAAVQTNAPSESARSPASPTDLRVPSYTG